MRNLEQSNPREQLLQSEFSILSTFANVSCQLMIAEEDCGSSFDPATGVIAIDLIWNDEAAKSVTVSVETLDLISLSHEFAHLLQSQLLPNHRWTLMLREGVADIFAGYWLRKRNLVQEDFPYAAIADKVEFYGKKKDMLLLPGLKADGVEREQDWGMDALFVRDTAGCGGVTLYVNGKAFPVRSPQGVGAATFINDVKHRVESVMETIPGP